MVQYEISIQEKAELRYRDLILQFGAIPKEVIAEDKELLKLATRVTTAYTRFRRRQGQRKFKKYASFVSLANQLEKKLLSIPLPVAGNTSEVGTPGIIQNV